jgi:hypothetical protein
MVLRVMGRSALKVVEFPMGLCGKLKKFSGKSIFDKKEGSNTGDLSLP